LLCLSSLQGRCLQLEQARLCNLNAQSDKTISLGQFQMIPSYVYTFYFSGNMLLNSGQPLEVVRIVKNGPITVLHTI
jgi:hypothetical protein